MFQKISCLSLCQAESYHNDKTAEISVQTSSNKLRVSKIRLAVCYEQDYLAVTRSKEISGQLQIHESSVE